MLGLGGEGDPALDFFWGENLIKTSFAVARADFLISNQNISAIFSIFPFPPPLVFSSITYMHTKNLFPPYPIPKSSGEGGEIKGMEIYSCNADAHNGMTQMNPPPTPLSIPIPKERK